MSTPVLIAICVGAFYFGILIWLYLDDRARERREQATPNADAVEVWLRERTEERAS
jgi:hypothetical protein